MGQGFKRVWEEDAGRVQTYVLENFDRQMDFVTKPQLWSHTMLAIRDLENVADAILSKKPDQTVCFQIGQAERSAYIVPDDTDIGSENPYREHHDDAHLLLEKYTRLTGFCGKSRRPSDPTWVPSGNRDILKQKTLETLDFAEKFGRKVARLAPKGP